MRSCVGIVDLSMTRSKSYLKTTLISNVCSNQNSQPNVIQQSMTFILVWPCFQSIHEVGMRLDCIWIKTIISLQYDWVTDNKNKWLRVALKSRAFASVWAPRSVMWLSLQTNIDEQSIQLDEQTWGSEISMNDFVATCLPKQQHLDLRCDYLIKHRKNKQMVNWIWMTYRLIDKIKEKIIQESCEKKQE